MPSFDIIKQFLMLDISILANKNTLLILVGMISFGFIYLFHIISDILLVDYRAVFRPVLFFLYVNDTNKLVKYCG